MADGIRDDIRDRAAATSDDARPTDDSRKVDASLAPSPSWKDVATQDPLPQTAKPPAAPARGLTLSTKLLLLTALAVMVAEVFVFVPSVANFRKTWLMERLQAAEIAAIAAEAAEGSMLPEQLKDELLTRANVRSIAVKYANSRQLIMREAMPPQVNGFFNLMDTSVPKLIVEALAALTRSDDRLIAVRGKSDYGRAEFVEIVMPERPLREAMRAFALNILGLSIVISLLTASLVYISLNALLVRPMERMVDSMIGFASDPEDAAQIMKASNRSDEVGTAERELARMQGELRAALHQRSRLAALGLAVSKINHDLRNMLANAQLISDRLSAIDDPTVQRVTPKLVGALDRAIRLCNDTLRFGQARERPPQRQAIDLASLAAEVGDSLGLPRSVSEPTPIAYYVAVPPELRVSADPDHLFRVLSNLVRNSAQVMDAEAAKQARRSSVSGVPTADPSDGDAMASEIRITAERHNTTVCIRVADTGPGVPDKARAVLFEAFRGTARPGGTGLGLAISAELIRAHGGQIRLCEPDQSGIAGAGLQTVATGAVFEITLPDPEIL